MRVLRAMVVPCWFVLLATAGVEAKDPAPPEELVGGPVVGGGGTESGNGDTDSNDTGGGDPCDHPCPNEGVQYVEPSSTNIGTQKCPRLKIGFIFGGWGLGLSFGSITCPRATILVPGHYTKVPKRCWQAVQQQGSDGTVTPKRTEVKCGYSATPGVSTAECVDGETVDDTPIYNFEETVCQ